MTYEPGQTLASLLPHLAPESVGGVHRQLGEAVAEGYTLQFLSFGETGPDGTVPAGDAYPAALLARAEHRIADPQHREVFASVLADKGVAVGAVHLAKLAHEDLNPNNILLRQDGGRWRLGAIVDFDCDGCERKADDRRHPSAVSVAASPLGPCARRWRRCARAASIASASGTADPR